MGLVYVFIGIVAILAFLILSFREFAEKQDSFQARLDRYVLAKAPDGTDDQGDVSQDPKSEKISDFLTDFGKIFTPATYSIMISKKLKRAHIPLRPTEFAAINLFTTVVPVIISWLFMKNIVLGIIGGAVGFVLPHLWLGLKITARVKAFNDQLLDALVMMSNSLKAGYAFLQAVDMISRETPPPISEEFGQVMRENQLGINLETSLLSMVERVHSEDLELLITVVLIQRQVGGNLAEVLDNISDTIRERMRIKGQIQTLTAQARMSGYVVAALPFALGLGFYVINPEYEKLLFTFEAGAFKGYYLVILGLVMMAVGFAIIMKITDIEV